MRADELPPSPNDLPTADILGSAPFGSLDAGAQLSEIVFAQKADTFVAMAGADLRCDSAQFINGSNTRADLVQRDEMKLSRVEEHFRFLIRCFADGQILWDERRTRWCSTGSCLLLILILCNGAFAFDQQNSDIEPLNLRLMQ